MFSIIFFVFVALILVVGFLAATSWGRKNQNSNTTDSNLSNTTTHESVRRSGSAFNERRSSAIKDRIVPTQRPLRDLDIENETGDDEGPVDRTTS